MTIALSHKIDPARSDGWVELPEPYWQGLERRVNKPAESSALIVTRRPDHSPIKHSWKGTSFITGPLTESAPEWLGVT
jgi:hypothetical protein